MEKNERVCAALPRDSLLFCLRKWKVKRGKDGKANVQQQLLSMSRSAGPVRFLGRFYDAQPASAIPPPLQTMYEKRRRRSVSV